MRIHISDALAFGVNDFGLEYFGTIILTILVLWFWHSDLMPQKKFPSWFVVWFCYYPWQSHFGLQISQVQWTLWSVNCYALTNLSTKFETDLSSGLGSFKSAHIDSHKNNKQSKILTFLYIVLCHLYIDGYSIIFEFWGDPG